MSAAYEAMTNLAFGSNSDLPLCSTANIKKAVRGEETTVLDALGISWREGTPHIRCPYPDHEDESPSWRWDQEAARAYCTCDSGDIFDVVMKMEGLNFEAAKIRIAKILGHDDLIIETAQDNSPSGAAALLNPPDDLLDEGLPINYLASRLGVSAERVPVPHTRIVGWTQCPYFDPPTGDDKKPILVGEYPCAIFETVGPDGATHAHRIYTAAKGAGKADLGLTSSGNPRPTKKSAKGNHTSGQAAIWGNPDIAPKAILTEGIETGAAVALAFADKLENEEFYVAAAISATGIEAFKPWPETRHVIVAADRDEAQKGKKPGSKRGEIAARNFGARNCEKLQILIALPGNDGETVDWLDILRRDGVEAVREGVNAAEFFQATKEELRKNTNKPRLSIGSDVEIAGRISNDLNDEYGTVIFSEGSYWHYCENHWKPFSDSEIRLQIHRYDGAIYGDQGRIRLGKGRIDSILNELAAMLDEPIFFANPTIGINCTSGFIEFDKRGHPNLTEHHPKHRCRHVMPGRWPTQISEVEAESPLLTVLLAGCFKGDPDAKEKINLLAEIAGATALGYATKLIKPKAVVFKGETAENGKSQVLDILRGLLPEDACACVPLGKFGDEKYVIHLVGKHLNASDELTSASAIASDTFKQIVTGEPVSGRDVYKPMVSIRPVAQHVFATNDLPNFRGGMDRGVRRRLLVITFNQVIPESERIEHIGQRIVQEESDLLLDWAVQGASQVIRDRKFTEPASSQEALRDWLLGADPVLAWLDEAVTIVLGQEAPRVKTSDAYNCFRGWAVAAGYRENSLPAVNNFTQRVLAAEKGITKSRDAKGRYLEGVMIQGAKVLPAQSGSR